MKTPQDWAREAYARAEERALEIRRKRPMLAISSVQEHLSESLLAGIIRAAQAEAIEAAARVADDVAKERRAQQNNLLGFENTKEYLSCKEFEARRIADEIRALAKESK